MAGMIQLLAAALFTGLSLALRGACADQATPPPPAVRPTVNVTFYVQGVVNVFTSHYDPPMSGSASAASNYFPSPSAITSPPDAGSAALPDIIHKLMDRNPNGTVTASVTVDFGAMATSVVTGDVVNAPVTLTLTANQARKLGLTVDGVGGPKRAAGGRRRLLSKRHEAARRMVLDFHGTRRSLQEVVNLYQLLGTINSLPRKGLTAGPGIRVLEKSVGQDLFVVNGKPQQVSSLTFVFKSSSCGVFPALNASRIRSFWYDNGDNAKIVATMERYHKVCTYNQLLFPKGQNLVFDVDIPCIGSTALGPYNLKWGKGNKVNIDNELYGLVELGRTYLQKTDPDLANKWASFRRKIIIFPFNYNGNYARFSGLASLGCAPDEYNCITWLNPSLDYPYVDQPVVFQELGHNIGLAHSGRWRGSIWDEYGDLSCPMGSARPLMYDLQLMCTTAPQSYKAGWASPIPGGEVNLVKDLQIGVPVEYKLPAMALSKQNMLRIITQPRGTFEVDDGSQVYERALFVSYRVRQSGNGTYDSGLNDGFNNRVWVHEFNETANAIPSNYRRPPTVLAMLTDDVVRDPSTRQMGPPNVPYWGVLSRSFAQFLPATRGGVTVTVVRKTPQDATVSVCRMSGRTESGGAACQDGVDNDCDGLFDFDDPDCQSGGGFGVSPQRSPSSPSPPWPLRFPAKSPSPPPPPPRFPAKSPSPPPPPPRFPAKVPSPPPPLRFPAKSPPPPPQRVQPPPQPYPPPPQPPPAAAPCTARKCRPPKKQV